MRLFVAVDPGPLVIDRIGQRLEALRPRAPRAKWVDAAQLHFTLVFLGEIDAPLAPTIAAALAEVAAAHDRLALRFAGGGSFGAPRRPRVLWVDTLGDREALSALQRALEVRLLPPDKRSPGRAFAPHLTLARSRDPRGDPALADCAAALAGDFGEATVTSVVLYESVLGRGGARYTKVIEAKLR